MDNETTPEPKSRLTMDMPTKKPRGFKIALLIMAVLLVLFVCTIVFLPYFLPIGTIRGIAQSQARDLAGVHLDFANLRFGWNGDLVLDDITVSPLGPDGAPGEALLTINEVRTNVALTPLLSGKAVVNSVDVNGFVVNLVRDAEGRLNLPDFEKLGQPPAAPEVALAGGSNRLMLSAAYAAEEAAPAAPPVELRQVNLREGLILFNDEAQGMNFDVGVRQVHIEGGTSLDDPFTLSGQIHPFSEKPELGAIDFNGVVALLRNGALDLDAGSASIEASLADLSLAALAEKLQFADLLPAGTVNGSVKAGYAEGKAGLGIPEMNLAGTVLGMGGAAPLSLPDTRLTLNASFDPATDAVALSSASVKNDLVDLTAGGAFSGVSAALAGGLPGADVNFGGSIDFSRASHYLSTQVPGLQSLPELDGQGQFSGTAALPASAAGATLAPTITLALESGDLQVMESASGIVAAIGLKGVTVAANAELAAVPVVQSRVELTAVPVRAFVPQLGDSPVTAVLTGGAAFQMSADAMVAELRADGATAVLPATPFSQAADITEAVVNITADLKNDVIAVRTLSAVVNDSIRASVANGTVRGVLAGTPQASAELQLSALLAQLRALVQPVYPADLLPQLEGTLRASAKLDVAGNKAEARISTEIDNARAVLALGGAQAELRSPKGTAGILATLDPAAPERISVQTFEASAAAADIGYRDAAGTTVSGTLGNTAVKLAGVVDAAAMLAELSGFSVDSAGLTVGLAENGAPAATVSSTLMRVAVGAAQQPLRLPLTGTGDFAVPQFVLGMDNLAFRYASEGGTQESQLGNLRFTLAADGYVGPEKRQLINVRTANLEAAPAVVHSLAQMDLGTGAFVARYASRVAPAGLSSVLAYLGLPPALLTDAAATGDIAFNNGQITSKGQANGSLSTGQGEVTPFETAHDLSAAWNPADGSLDLEIRRLDSNLKTAAGEAVATMAAQPSRLLLSRAGSRGTLDVRFSGSAGPTRAMALGLAGVLPQLADVATTLNSMQAAGMYNAWIQVKEKDPSTLGFNIGGTWKGAALSIANVPYLSEAGALSAALEGDFAYQQNTLHLSRLLLSSDSAQMRAEGAASVVYAADASHMPVGLSTVNANLRFDAADIALAGRVFPGVLPPAMGLAGRVGGTLSAAGNADNVQISQGVVNFQNFRVIPSDGLEVTIPQGAANLAASLALHFSAPPTGSAYDIFRMIDINGGRVNLTGAMVRGKQVDNMASTFELRGGLFTVGDAQVVIGGGAAGQIALNGTVDFNQPAPAVNVRLALRNIPLAEVNSELGDEYVQFREGLLRVPSREGQSAGVAFSGFSDVEILRTLRLDNFNFATGPVTLDTGPALNAELDKAGVLLKMGNSGGQARQITLASLDGSAVADGRGLITFPQERPINVIGGNTADFRVQGSIRADQTVDVNVMIAGNLQKMITVPNLIPNLSLADGNQERNLMSRMNENAAKGNYGVHVTGPLSAPDISGIGAVAAQFLRDLVASVPTQLLGNVLDAPESVLKLGQNVVGGLANPGETLKNAPENLVQGLGGMFGLGGNSSQQQQQPQTQQQQQPQQQQQQRPEQQLLRGLGNLLGGSRR